MLMRFDPFRELDRLTEDLWGGGRAPAARTMPLDAFRHGDRFVVRIDLPGVDPASIDLTVERNVLTIRAERQWAREEGTQVLVSERPQGTFSRQLFLSEGLDPSRVDASYEHGVLTLTVPVAESARPHKVEVKWNGQSASAIEASSTEGNASQAA